MLLTAESISAPPPRDSVIHLLCDFFTINPSPLILTLHHSTFCVLKFAVYKIHSFAATQAIGITELRGGLIVFIRIVGYVFVVSLTKG